MKNINSQKNDNVYKYIEEHFEQFTNTEKRFVHFLLSNKLKAPFLSAYEIANRIKANSSTLIDTFINSPYCVSIAFTIIPFTYFFSSLIILFVLVKLFFSIMPYFIYWERIKVFNIYHIRQLAYWL